jgi:sphingolipid delta-4 desaturase
VSTDAVAWHAERRRRIANEHPEIKSLMGPDRRSMAVIAGLTVLQLGLAVWLRGAPWSVVLLVAYIGGAFVSHALGVMVHEASHGLVAQRRWVNSVWLLITNIPLVVPVAIAFRHEHLLHHRYLGEVEKRDTQSPSSVEARWVGNSTWRKIFSFTFGHFVYPGRPDGRTPHDVWWKLNAWVQIATMIPLVRFAGWKPLVYLVVSSFAGFGPHPLGARRLSEHLPVKPDQPTNSYYGPLDAVTLHVGYHVEHHDFPGISWRRLPRLKRLANRYYAGLFSVRSWSLLLAEYFFSPSYRPDHYLGLTRSLSEEAGGRLETLYGDDPTWTPLAEDSMGARGPNGRDRDAA